MSRRRLFPEPLVVPLAFVAIKLVLQAIAITNYGWFRDELYYIVCSQHLAWGYVDHPPFSIAALALERALLGGSLVALRVFPALVGAATVLVTGLLVRELGGRRFAQALACLCVVVAPVFLAVDHFFSMNTFDQLFWALSALLLVRALATQRPAIWLWLGLTLGLGLVNKTSVLWLGGALGLGLLLTPHRRVLGTRWPWLAAALAAAIFAPHVLWQVRNGWPTLEFMRNATLNKMVRTPFAAFWIQQVLVMNPVTLLVWLPGLTWLLLSPRWRILGLVFVAVATLLVATGSSRPNYLTVAYPMLLAGGGVAIESFAAARGRAWVRVVALALVGWGGAPIMPMGLPVLPVETFITYQHALGIRPRSQEHTREGDLTQFYSDMFGWEDLARRVANVYHGLSSEEQAKCAIYGNNYGEAAAIDVLGRHYGLPPAISGHNTYWMWGTHGATGEVIILVGGRRNDPHADFRSVVLADTTACEHCMPYENGAPIFVCRGLNMPLSQRWPAVRSYH
jgi:hypothetical protein